MKNKMAVMLRTELHRIYVHICVRFVLTNVYIPLANVLRLTIYSTICGLQPINTHIHQLSHHRRLLNVKGQLNSYIHSAVRLTTGPKPLPKRALHIVRSRASSFK